MSYFSSNLANLPVLTGPAGTDLIVLERNNQMGQLSLTSITTYLNSTLNTLSSANVVNGELILTRGDGSTLNAGVVTGVTITDIQPHRYWALMNMHPTNSTSNPNDWGIAAATLFPRYKGADLTVSSIRFTSPHYANLPATNLIDGTNSIGASMVGGGVVFDLGSAKAVDAFRLVTRPDALVQYSPGSFNVVYSDDNINFHPVSFIDARKAAGIADGGNFAAATQYIIPVPTTKP